MNKNKISRYIETVEKGNTYISNRYLLDNRLLDAEKTLLTLLQASCFGDKIETYPSQSTLAKALNKSVRSIQRYLKKLIKLNYISVRRRGSVSNVYRMKIKETMLKAQEFIKKAHKFKKYKEEKRDKFNDIMQRDYTSEQLKDLENKLLGWT